jgi:hypothetical protein
MVPKYLSRDIETALKSYPLLKIFEREGKVFVTGEIPLTHSSYGEFDCYSVCIRFPIDYPKRFPIVIETSKKIPRIPNRHINDIDNSLCLAVLPEELKISKNGITFKYFLDKILVPHLSRETYYSIEKKYPDGEYEHGSDGIWKYFQEILEITDREILLFELNKIINAQWVGRNEDCGCGSRLKFKKCHLSKWNKVLETGKENMKLIIEHLKKEIIAN